MTSFQEKHAILVAAPAAYDRPPPSSRWLIESSRRYGIELALLGQLESYHNTRSKVRFVAEHLRKHREYRYVLQVDFKDVIFCATLPEIFHKYRSFGHDVVAAAERVHWPIPSHRYRSPTTGTSFRYLNSGTIFATSEAWLAAWDAMEAKRLCSEGNPPELGMHGFDIFSDDQAAWSDLYVNGEADIALDARCDLFQALNKVDFSIGTSNRDLRFEGRRVVNRETGGRPCLIHANANIPLDPWAGYVLDPSPVWIWPLVDRIRNAPLDYLRDVESLERLLLDLGFHDRIGDCIPDAMLPFTGRGLSTWQQPNQFASYLTWLATRPPIQSYMEIGVDAGGSFITSVEYLRRFHPLRLAIAVDPRLTAPIRDYAARTAGVRLVEGTSSSDELRSLVGRTGAVDLVFIDGDHAHDAVRADWDFASRFARYVALHDVASDIFPGVQSLWTEIRSAYCKTQEFVQEYSACSPGFGLGVVDLAFGG
jgi:hypothetical protein